MYWFQLVKARKEEEMKAAHDEAMFGGSSYPPPAVADIEAEDESHRKENMDNTAVKSLLNDQVII